MKKRLTDISENTGELEKAIASLKKMGMDVSKIEDNLNYAKSTAKELLKTFGK